jgi:hypothetical protein
MVADGMLTRKRYREVPPRVDYELTERARELMPILGELARWGYEWAWSPPRTTESVDIGAIFRLAPGLLQAPERSGTVQCVVDGDHGRTYTLTLSASGTDIAERPADMPDVSIAGRVPAWIDAFSPQRERGGLQVDGDAALASLLLDALAGAERAEAAEGARVAAA